MDIEDYTRNKIIVDKFNGLDKYVLGSDKFFIQNLRNNSLRYIHEYEKNQQLITSYSKKEDNQFKATTRRRVIHYFFRDYINDLDLQESNLWDKAENTFFRNENGNIVWLNKPLYDNIESTCNKLSHENGELEVAIKLAISKTKFSNQLKTDYTLYLRLEPNGYKPPPGNVYKEINEAIKNQILAEFMEQNESLIIKYSKNYETSK
tara:strand:+ start:662 stop:1279 length:618 start_codon:yes stop_codon:yes gene_type:complete